MGQAELRTLPAADLREALGIAGLSPADPHEADMSAGRLARLTDMLESHTRAEEIAGALAVVVRGDRVVYCRAVGWQDAGLGIPMSASSVFRIYSMTKPLTSLVALTLVEEGRLLLSDPVANHLPAFQDVAVLADVDDYTVTVPVDRPVTVYDLLRHTAGLGGGVYGTPALKRAYAATGILPYDHTPPTRDMTTQEFVDRLTRIPLARQPGTAWEYGRAGEVVGRLVEVVTGEPFDHVLSARLCRPLGMVDTGFTLTGDQLPRLAAARAWPTELPPPADPTVRPRFLSTGSGAFCTGADYLRFLLALRAGGGPVASRASVANMTADHLAGLRGTGPDYIPGPGYGFGLGVGVRLAHAAPTLGSPGEFNWLGRAGTSFFVSPADDLIGMLFTQRFGRPRYYQPLFRNLVYQARK